MATDEEGLLGRYRQRRKSSRRGLSFGPDSMAASVIRLSIAGIVFLAIAFLLFSLGFNIFTTLTGVSPLEEEQMNGTPILEKVKSIKTGSISKVKIEDSFKYTPLKTGDSYRKDVLKSAGSDALVVKKGDKVSVHYIGYHTDGKIFDSSKAPNRNPFQVEVGASHVIKGWDEGLVGSKKGDIIRLTISADYAYGARGSPPTIQPGEVLIFGIEIVDVFPAIPSASPPQANPAPAVPLTPPPDSSKRATQIFGPNEFIYVPLETTKPWRKEKLKQALDNAPKPKKYDVTTVEYTGYLIDGTVFNSSKAKGNNPLKFVAGGGGVIKGLDEAVLEMKKGEICRLTVSPQYGYGASGDGKLVTPNSVLIIIVELVEIESSAGPIAPNDSVRAQEKVAPSSPQAIPGTAFTENDFKYTPLQNDVGWEKLVLRQGLPDAIKPRVKDIITIHYTGYLSDGQVFESSKVGGKPPSRHPIGEDKFIKGWEEALLTMKKGEIARLTISPEFAYGSRGNPPKIPPDATLIFVIEMIDISSA